MLVSLGVLASGPTLEADMAWWFLEVELEPF